MADNYLSSKYVKVCPTARRGGYTDSTTAKTYTYDPEARIPSEYNQVNHYSKTTAKSNYIVSYNATNGFLNCVIGGYYFEITTDIRNYNYLGIRTENVVLVDHLADTRTTTVLASFASGDSKLDNASGEFTGLLATIDLTEDFRNKVTDYLQIFVVPTPEGADKKINPEALLIDSIILTGTGENSIVGKGNTKQTGDFSVTLGKNNENSGGYSFVYGSTINNTKQNSVLFGKNITNNKENQVIFSGFDNYNFDNKLTLDDKGIIKANTTAVGNTTVFEIMGSTPLLKINGAGSTTMQGALIVNGAGSSKIAGNLTVGGLTVGGATALNNTLKVAGSSEFTTATFTDAVSMAKTLSVGGNISANTIETANGLTINGDITTGGALTGPEGTYQLTNNADTGTTLYGATINKTSLALTSQKITLGNGNITIQENNGVLEIIC